MQKVQVYLDASQQTDQRLLPDQCLLPSGCAYKQPETRASVVPRILLSFRHRKQLIFQAILKDKGLQILSYTLRRRKYVFGKRELGFSTLSQYFQVYYTISKLVVRIEQN